MQEFASANYLINNPDPQVQIQKAAVYLKKQVKLYCLANSTQGNVIVFCSLIRIQLLTSTYLKLASYRSTIKIPTHQDKFPRHSHHLKQICMFMTRTAIFHRVNLCVRLSLRDDC